MLNSFLTDVALMAGFGALLDQVLVASSERKRLAAYLKNGTNNLSFTERFSNFLEMSHSIIFGRFFSSNIFSWGFLRSAAVVSLISVSIVLFAQAYFFYEQFERLTLDGVQFTLFASFIVFNILFDYVTIIQTKVFIEASLSAKSIFRALIFIGTDLIVTMNMFILSYAVFLLLVVQVFIATPKPVTMILSEKPAISRLANVAMPRFLSEYENQEFVKNIAYSGTFGGALMSKGDSVNPLSFNVFFYSTFDSFNAVTKAYLLANLTKLNLVDVRISVVEGEERNQRLQSVLNEGKTAIQQYLEEGQDESGLIEIDFSVDGSIANDGALNTAYTAAFNLADRLEDGFPNSITGQMELLKLSTLITRMAASTDHQDPIVVCFKNGLPAFRFRMNDQTMQSFESCDDYVIVERFWANAFDKNLILAGRDISGYQVPFNTLMITSLLPTAFFYLAILLMALTTVIYSKAIKGTNRAKKYFLRAPFTLTGSLLGIILSLTGII